MIKNAISYLIWTIVCISMWVLHPTGFLSPTRIYAQSNYNYNYDYSDDGYGYEYETNPTATSPDSNTQNNSQLSPYNETNTSSNSQYPNQQDPPSSPSTNLGYDAQSDMPEFDGDTIDGQSVYNQNYVNLEEIYDVGTNETRPSSEYAQDPITQEDPNSQPLSSPTSPNLDFDVPSLPKDPPDSSTIVNLKPIVLPSEMAEINAVKSSLGVLPPGEAPHHYVIQQGDTLFDICDQLLDEPNYWPKLWSLNPEIKNPHFVWPGMILRFYPGDDFIPPFLEIQTEEDIDPVYLDGDFLPESLVQSPLKLIDEDKAPITPISLFPDLLNSQEAAEIPRIPLNTNKTPPNTIHVHLPFFVFDKKISQLGTIIGSTLNGYSLNHYGVLLARDSLQSGQTYSVVRYSHKIREPHTGKFLGYQYRNLGDITINETRSDQLHKAKAAYYHSPVGHLPRLNHQVREMAFYQLTQRIGHVKRGDMVIEKTSSAFKFSGQVNSIPKDVDSTVAGFLENNQTLISPGQFMVISNNSLNEGELISVYKNKRVMTNLSPLNQYTKIGVARVMKVSERSAIAYVMNASDSIMVGDRCQPP